MSKHFSFITNIVVKQFGFMIIMRMGLIKKITIKYMKIWGDFTFL